MKKIRRTVIILFLVTLVFAGLFHFAGRGVKAEDREYAIVVSVNASSTEMYAALTLQEYLYELNNSYYEIITDDQPFEGFRFCVGATSLYDTSADLTGKTADSYVIAPFSSGLAIFGAGSRGTLYGVHSFLEEFCGYRCYAWYPVMIKTSDEMKLPSEKIEYEPFFEYRNTDWRSGWMSTYSVSHLLNGALQYYAPEQGGNIPYLGPSGSHTLANFLCSAQQYFADHPEYFAMHNGTRVPGQLCLTNESVYEIVLQEVLDILEEEHDPAADLQIISLSQADNLDYCECENCRSLDEANGSHAGSLITFVNRIADAVKGSGYDNVAFDTLAYTYTRKAPALVKPRDNVIVRLCTFECCFSHALDDSDCQVNRELMGDLAEWSEICDRIYIWDYTTNFAYTLGIFPDFHTLQRNMQCFYEYGIKGVYEEGNYYVDRCDTEFGELRTFLIAELMENPYCSYDAKMLEFCNYYYGKGGAYIKEVIDELTDSVISHVSIYERMGDTFSIDEEKAERIDQLWTLAEDAADNSEEALAAIKRSKLSWRYVKAVLGLREFSGTLEDNRDAREELYNDLIAHGIRMIDEWTWIEDDFSEYELIPVEEWEYAARYAYLVYDFSGGTEGPDNQWSFNNRVSDIIPSRRGYLFQGWATSPEVTVPEYQPGDYIFFDTDLVLYALWERDPQYVPKIQISLAGMSTEGIELSWDDPEAEKYELFRDGQLAETVSGCRYLDDVGSTMGRQYAYQVRGCVNETWTELSDPLTVIYDPFADVPQDSDSFSHVAWAYNNGIVNGLSSDHTRFGLTGNCTRAQFCIMLWKMAGKPDTTGMECPFTDIDSVTGNNKKAIIWCYNQGIINGTSETSFKPSGRITRAQLAIMIWKMAGKPTVAGMNNPYTDIDTLSANNRKAVIWCYNKGLIGSLAGTEFSPKTKGTRAFLVEMLYGYYRFSIGE